MYISPISQTASQNINTKGYLKDRRFLMREYKIASFNLNSVRNAKNQAEYDNITQKFKNFVNKNKIKTFICEIPNFFTYIINRKDILAKKHLKGLSNSLFRYFNNLTFNFDGQELSDADFMMNLQKISDPQKRKEYLKGYMQKIEDSGINNRLSSLIMHHNEYAKKKGYKNYFEYQLKQQHNLSVEELDKMIEDFYQNNNVYERLKTLNESISKEYGIKEDDISNQHYINLFSPDEINKFIESSKQIYELTKNCLTSMGFDIDKLEKERKIIYNIYPQEGATNDTCCQYIDKNLVGIKANLGKTVDSFSYLMHEMGHAMYRLNSPTKNLNNGFNEGVALLFEKIFEKESLLNETVPKDILEDYKKNQEIRSLIRICKNISILQTEREMYENPNQEFREIAEKNNRKYCLNNSDFWFIPHYIAKPCYYSNYFIGAMCANQLYDSLHNKLGTELCNNKKTAKLLQSKLFGWGNFMNKKLFDYMFNKTK